MARLIFPHKFLLQVQLLDVVKERHDALGANSPLTGYLSLHHIDLANCVVAGEEAFALYKKQGELERDAENFTEKRNIKFKPVWKRVKGCMGFLKSLYAPNTKEVGNWGAPITGSGRLNFPAGFLNRAEIFKVLKAKSDSFLPPAVNPLAAYLAQQGISLTASDTALGQAVQHHLKASQYAKDAEDAREKRVLLWNPIAAHLRAIGALLMKLFGNNPSQAGLWGFNVDSSKRAPKLRTTRVKPASMVSNKSVKIGGTFTNLGKVELIIYKGKKVSTPAMIVKPGESLIITKGFSFITIANKSTLSAGIFSVNSVY